MFHFLHENNMIPKHPFGFRARHGIVEQVNTITNEIRRPFKHRVYCLSIFLDVAQAFDSTTVFYIKLKQYYLLNCIKY